MLSTKLRKRTLGKAWQDSEVGRELATESKTNIPTEDVRYARQSGDPIPGLVSVPACICINFRIVLSSWRMACKVDWQLHVQQFAPPDEFTAGSSPEHQREEWHTPNVNSAIIKRKNKRHLYSIWKHLRKTYPITVTASLLGSDFS